MKEAITDKKEYLLSVLQKILQIIDEYEYNIHKIRKNKDFLKEIKKSKVVIRKMNENGLLNDWNIIDFYMIPKRRSNNTFLFKISLFFTRWIIFLIAIVLILIYLINGYISTPGLQYSKTQYHVFSKISFLLLTISGIIVFYFFVKLRQMSKKQKNIYDYYDFIFKLKKLVSSLSKKDIEKIIS